jgi:uncharacterized membrane protein YqjE
VLALSIGPRIFKLLALMGLSALVLLVLWWAERREGEMTLPFDSEPD